MLFGWIVFADQWRLKIVLESLRKLFKTRKKGKKISMAEVNLDEEMKKINILYATLLSTEIHSTQYSSQ